MPRSVVVLGRAQGLFRLPEALQAWFEGVVERDPVLALEHARDHSERSMVVAARVSGPAPSSRCNSSRNRRIFLRIERRLASVG